MNVVLNCWEQGPKTRVNGQKVRGGPQLSGNLPDQLPAMCDVVLRAVVEPSRQPWPTAYHCEVSPTYNMKDRFDVACRVHPAPMNLAELLRASGRSITRHPGIEGQEEQVQVISQTLDGSADDTAKANQFYRTLIADGTKPSTARWTLRDAIDRALIRRTLATQESNFFTSTASTFLG